MPKALDDLWEYVHRGWAPIPERALAKTLGVTSDG